MPIIKTGDVENHVHSIESLIDKLSDEQKQHGIYACTERDGKAYFVTGWEEMEHDGEKNICLWLEELK